MPVYDYECEGCGVFTVMRPMSSSSTPCDCPQCGSSAPRTFLAMPALFGMSAMKRRAQSGNEESRSRPKTVEEYKQAEARSHPAGCGCCSGTKRSGVLRADGAKTFPSSRPWMISH